MRYRFLYLPLALLGLAEPGCVGGQTGDTTGFSDSDPFNTGNVSAGGSGLGEPNFGSGPPSNDGLGSGGNLGVPGSGGTTANPGIATNGPEAGSGGQASNGGAGGTAGEGGSAGDTSLDGGVTDLNALTASGQDCDDEHVQRATVDDAGMDASDDAGTVDTNFAPSPNCH
jgi:hypothetical protein